MQRWSCTPLQERIHRQVALLQQHISRAAAHLGQQRQASSTHPFLHMALLIGLQLAVATVVKAQAAGKRQQRHLKMLGCGLQQLRESRSTPAQLFIGQPSSRPEQK